MNRRSRAPSSPRVPAGVTSVDIGSTCAGAAFVRSRNSAASAHSVADDGHAVVGPHGRSGPFAASGNAMAAAALLGAGACEPLRAQLQPLLAPEALAVEHI